MTSMTGFGRAEGEAVGLALTVETKSVNHRYLDIRTRLPHALSQLENRIHEAVREKFQRGSVEVNLRTRPLPQGGPGNVRFALDEGAAKSFMDVCDALHMKFQTQKCPSLETILQTGKIIVPVEECVDNEDQLQQALAVVVRALEGMAQMRQSEGTKLRTLLEDGLQNLVTAEKEIRKLAGLQPERVREKLVQRIAQWKLGDVDPNRLEWEVAFYAERADVTEELDRLEAHTRAFAELLEKKDAVGRKLDFLTQEMHREVNTVASKSGNVEVTQLAVGAKTIVEKLREQIQNVE